MRVGIPEYRLPNDVLDSEIEEIKQAGFEIKPSTRIESLDDLFAQGYHAVFLAIGAHQGTRMGIDGEDSSGILEAITFLREVSLGQQVTLGSKVAVIGGGNVAIDASRTALRLNVKDVTIIYRRTRSEMPASSEEIEGALEEGVKFIFLAAPNKVWNENGRASLECGRMELGEPDTSGRRRPVPIKDSEFTTDYDTVIAAIGQTPEVPKSYQVATGRGNVLQIDDDCSTNREGVFAGGDAVTGPASVIKAIAAGRKGAIAIDKYLGGSGVIAEELAQLEEPKACIGREEGFAHLHRHESPCLPAEERLNSFDEIEDSYGEETATKEALRCLQCDLRMKISPVKFPPKKSSVKGAQTS